MLAQNFKTPVDLGIEDREFSALVRVLGMLERGELVDVQYRTEDTNLLGFNIGCQYAENECGTLACIGGWAAKLMGHKDPMKYVDGYMNGGSLHELFWVYPAGPYSYHGKRPKVAEAAIALRNFLTFGEPRWAEIEGEA